MKDQPYTLLSLVGHQDHTTLDGKRVYATVEALERVTRERDEARALYESAHLFRRAEKAEAEATRLREALEGLAGDTPGPDSRPCWCHESDCACRNRAWCVAAREALKGGGK